MARRRRLRRASTGDQLLPNGPTEDNSHKIVPILCGYFSEAEQARRSGLNPRDDKWEENLNLYWNRYDHSNKAEWQARETLPEVPAFVDRFAAALKEALVSGDKGFYDIEDPADREGDITNAIKRMTDVWLSTCGRNQTGTCLGFPAVFEEQIKLGALMACASATVWKNDTQYGRVAIETVDPRSVYLDHTYRNLYRIRRIELDKHELRSMAKMADSRGRPLYNLAQIEQMVSNIEWEIRQQLEQLTGAGTETSSTRQPIIMDEYIATVVDNEGKVLAENALMVVGNNQFLIRGPEPIPYAHGKDWLTFCPLVTAPLSVYGRSYMEDFGTIATAFTNLTNLLLDAVQMSSLKAYAVVPSLLLNPDQIMTGITPNKVFHLEDGVLPEQFLKEISLGELSQGSFQMWEALKNELREAADINEVGLGQFAPKGRTSATEITGAQENSSAVIRSMAQTIETRWLNPTLDLVWKTGLQHARPNDTMLRAAAGDQMYSALLERRAELIRRPITFQAKGISTLIQKTKMLRALLQLVGFMSQSPELLAEFTKVADLNKFMKYLFELSDIDISKFEITERQQLLTNTAQQFQNAAQQRLQEAQQTPRPSGTSESGPSAPGQGAQIAQMLGVSA